MQGMLSGYCDGLPTRKVQQVIDAVFCVLVGVLAAMVAVILGSRSSTAVILGILAIASLPVILILWLNSERVVAKLLVAAMALSIPINLDVNLLYRHHVGGAPSITVNTTLLLLIVFFLVWAYRYATGLQQHFVTVYRPLAWAGFAILALTPMSLLNAEHVDLVWLEWIRLLCLVLAMIATMSLQSRHLVRLWIFVLSLQVLIQAGLAGSQYALKKTLGLEIFGEQSLVEQNIGYIAARATGTVGHPNVLSYFFEILLPVMLALALTRQPGRRQLWFGLVFVAGLGGILTTLSRGSWLTLPVSLGIVVLFVYGRRIVRIRSAVIVFLIGCLLAGASYFAYPVIEKRFTHTDYKSAQSRMPLNLASISIIEKYPVFGVGLNNFAEVFKREDETGKSRIFRGYQHVVHNLHLWILTETGIVGYIAFLAPFMVTIGIALKVGPRAPPVDKAILAGISAGFLAHLAHGMVDPGFRVSIAVSFLIFTLMGIAGAIALQNPARTPYQNVRSAPN
jgi:O-antigen ligase